MKIDRLLIAKEFAQKIGNDLVREAGEKNGWQYYHILRQATMGHKLGLPHIVKINEMGHLVAVLNLKEQMWAINQEILIYNS